MSLRADRDAERHCLECCRQPCEMLADKFGNLVVISVIDAVLRTLW